MRVLVIGSGGREHALCWKLAHSQKVDKLFAAPGNAGITQVAEIADISAGNIEKLATFAEGKKIDLTVVGPELPLVGGIVDEFERRNLRVFGPNRRASVLEGSKVFMKKFLTKYKIPTANYASFTDASKAKKYIEDQVFPLVIKADGLAAGKGVIICKSKSEAETAIDSMLKKKIFGSAGDTVIVEEFLCGEEASYIVISDGTNILPLASSQDHKPVYDNDEGPNTGGMGAYSPAPLVSRDMEREIVNQIMIPTIEGMKSEGREFKGFLYAGIIIQDNRPYVLEFNVRCGDPETQPLMVRLKSDLIELLEAAIERGLDSVQAEWEEKAAVSVVMSSKGYPGSYEKGFVINGIEDAEAIEDVVVFHAGTLKNNGSWLTNGGRVLAVTAKDKGIGEAISRAYKAIDKISWNGVHFRRDIGQKAMKYITNGQIDLY